MEVEELDEIDVVTLTQSLQQVHMLICAVLLTVCNANFYEVLGGDVLIAVYLYRVSVIDYTNGLA